MTIFTPYTGTPPDPNYLSYSKTPDAIKPNVAMGKLFEGLGDIVEMGIKGVDLIQKKSLEDEAEPAFQAANQEEIARLTAQRDAISGGKPPPGYTPPEVTPFAEPDGERGPVGPFGRNGTVENAPIKDDSPLPVPVQRQLTYLQKVGQAGLNGKLNAAGVQMNGEAIMSDLLQRYPNRAEQIRSIAAKYGFGDGKLQAQLRGEINQWQQLTQAKDGKDETWENTNRDVLVGTKDAPGIFPDYFKMSKEQRRSPEMRDQLQQRIGNYEAIKKNNETEQSSITIRGKRKEELADDQSRVWTSRIALEEGVGFRNLMEGMGFKGVNTVEDFLQSWRTDPRNSNPAALQELGSKLQQYKVAKTNKWIRDAANTYVGKVDEDGRPIDPKTPTVLEVLKRDGLDKLHSEALGHIDALQKVIDSKGAAASFDFAGASARENQGKLDNKVKEIYTKYPVVLGTKALQEQFGPQLFGQMYTQSTSKIRAPLDTAAQAIIDGTTSAIVLDKKDSKTGKPITINDTLHDYSHLWGINGKGAAPKPQDLSGLMDRVKTNLMNPALPPDVAVKFGKYVFSDDRLFPQLKGADKQKFLNAYASPEVSKRIFSLGDTELTDNYKKWVNNAVLATTQETVSNFNAVVTRGAGAGPSGDAFSTEKYADFHFDPKTNRILGNTTSNESLYRELGTTPTRYASIKNQLETLRNSVTKINQSLATVEPILKQEKATISPEMTALIQSMGIKIKIGEEKGDDGVTKPIFEKRSEAAANAQVADITRINPATLQMQTSKPPVNTRINPAYPTGVKIQGPLGFADEDLPPSGDVGNLDSFLTNPAGQITAPVMAKGGGKKKAVSSNLSDNPIMGIQVDDIPDGMSARDFIKQLQSRP